MALPKVNAVIVGAGAGGGIAAKVLAEAGISVVLLERGKWYTAYDCRKDDLLNQRSSLLGAAFGPDDERYRRVSVDASGQETILLPSDGAYNNNAACVGGGTFSYGAMAWRYLEKDFRMRTTYGAVEGSTLDDWPISYQDLEPYYTQAENLYQVHGNRGEDPTEPAASSPYPWPAVSHEPRIQQLSDDFARSGLKPFHVPVGVMLDEKNPRKSRCIRCNTCDGFACLVGAKSDAQVVCIDEAVKHSNVTLLTNSLVKRLETDATGREVKGVVVERNGSQEIYSADVVVVSCGAINSAALLLRSANDKHPRGLANSSDIVGRHYMGHTNSVMMAISKCPNPTVFQKTLGVNDFYFGSKDFEYPMGHISFVGKLDAITLKAGAPAIAPNFTLEMMAKHSLDFWLTSEDLPDPNNRVTIGRDGKIVLTYTPNNLEAHERLKDKLKQAMRQTNCTMHGHECHQGLFGRNLYVGQRIPLAGVAHQNGTIRFGHDAKTSALDVNCKAHDVDNLYVVDGSFFPSSAAVNPALTIMANALRVGDHLLKRLGVSDTANNRNRQPELAATR